MGPLSVEYSLDDLLNELEFLEPQSQGVFWLALMLRDGFLATAPFVPVKYRAGIEGLIRSLATSDLILDWDRNEKPNIYRPTLTEWVAELNRVGWPPERPGPLPPD